MPAHKHMSLAWNFDVTKQVDFALANRSTWDAAELCDLAKGYTPA
jgi:hypothetical protein